MSIEPLIQTADTIVVRHSDKSFIGGGISLVFAGTILLLEFLSLTNFNLHSLVPVLIDFLFVAMMISGVLMILAGHLTILTFDKAQDKIFITPKGFFRKNRTFPTSDVECIALHRVVRFMPNTPNLYNQKLFLVFKSGEKIALRNEIAETPGAVGEETGLGTKIAQFIDVPFQHTGSSKINPW